MSAAKAMDGIFPFPALLADIGGTNARFCLKVNADAPLSPPVRLETGGFADFAAAAEAAVERGGFAAPRSLLIGAAGPVAARSVHLTNAAWRIDGPALAARLDLTQGLLLNDFETLALALPALQPGDVKEIGAGAATGGAKLVIGPGTGLGVGALAPSGAAWLPLSSEGGHIGFGPKGRTDSPLWEQLEAAGVPTQAEMLLAGPGLARLDAALARLEGGPESIRTPAEITARALAGGDPHAARVLALWLGLLARFSGDMALTFLATGGVYLAGGILPRIAPLIDAAAFRAAFEDNSVHRALLARVAVRLIVAEEPAMIGLAALAATPSRYGLDYAARLWR